MIGLSVAITGRLCGEETSSSTDPLEDLRRQVRELDQKIRALEEQRASDTNAAAAKAGEAKAATPTLEVGSSGVRVRSADSNFVFTVHGWLQVDNRSFVSQAMPGSDSFVLRRARPIFQATLFRDFDFVLVPEFGGSSVQVYDAYANYRYAPWLQLRAGKFKVPLGLEQMQPDITGYFPERGMPSRLMPIRDLGFGLWGDVGSGAMLYAVGVFSGVGDSRLAGSTDFENHREFAGRLFVKPFKNSSSTALSELGFGVGGTWGNISSNSAGLPATTGGTLPGYFTDGQQQFFAYNPTNGSVVANGAHWRLSPQGSYYYGPFSVMGEYVISDQEVSRTAAPFRSGNVRNTAWQVAAGWFVTGETDSYSVPVTPRHSFDPKRGEWGALQLVGRYMEMNVGDEAFAAGGAFANPATSASAAQAWSVGANWYLNRNVRLATSYTRTTFTGGGGAGAAAPAAVTRQPEDVVITRLQLAF